jgi:uncharacterized protein (UPF0276 family)
MARTRLAAGVGLGFRPEVAADLLRQPEIVDCVEVVADTCFAQPSAWREACAIAEILPVVPHGVKLSLGSASGVDLGRARGLGALARELRAEAVTEHVALTRAGECEIGHLTPLPFTRDSVRVVARNVASVRRVLPDVPFLLENIAWTFRWPEDEMPEGAFYAQVAEATGCGLLLDVANLYANARNAGIAPSRALAEFPLDRVDMMHVAGGVLEHGFFLDTHAQAVPDAVFALVEAALAATGAVPVILERDDAFPPFAELASEIDHLRALVSSSARRDPRQPASTPSLAPPMERGALETMARRQDAVARLLTATDAPAREAAAEFGEDAVARTRAVLQHKRVDEALPLTPRTAAASADVRALALRVVQASPRAPRGNGIADALRIVDAAAAEPTLAAAALRDRLELRSRFARQGPRGECGARRSPFVGRERLPDGRSIWALKGPGPEAPVRLLEWGGER